MDEEEKEKLRSSAKQRTAVITIKYHFITAGRRPGIRQDIAGNILRLIMRRLERQNIVVDDIQLREK